MSMQQKLRAVATQAAIEATTNERARCLWCVEQVLAELQQKLRGKLLGSAQLHATQVKFKIAEAVSMELRRAIVSGVRPTMPPAGKVGETGQTGVADFPTSTGQLEGLEGE